MTRFFRLSLLSIWLVLSISLVWYSVASANDAGAAVTDVVTAPADEAPVPAVVDPIPAEPAALVVTPEPDTAQSPAAIRLIDMLFDILSAALLILVPYFVHRLLSYFEKKTGLELSPYMQDKIDGLLDKGIAYAEEQGRKAIKKKEKALTMSEKLEHGANYVLDLADAVDAKGWTTEQVKKMLEGRLNQTRDEVEAGVTLSDPDVENVPA